MRARAFRHDERVVYGFKFSDRHDIRPWENRVPNEHTTSGNITRDDRGPPRTRSARRRPRGKKRVTIGRPKVFDNPFGTGLRSPPSPLRFPAYSTRLTQPSGDRNRRLEDACTVSPCTSTTLPHGGGFSASRSRTTRVKGRWIARSRKNRAYVFGKIADENVTSPRERTATGT